MSAVSTSECVYVEEGPGGVWASTPRSGPAVRWPTAEVAAEDRSLAGNSVRCRGTPRNAALLVRLYRAKSVGRIRSLEVCSPLAGGTANHGLDPRQSLIRIQAEQPSASCGGWHDFTALDVTSYAMAASPESRLEFLRLHPAWPAFSFLKPLDESAMADLVALLLDPRFFVDPFNPDRSDRVQSFLGLSRRNPFPDRLALVMRCWRFGLDGIPVSWKGVDGPGSFVCREAVRRGLVAASRLFVSYVTQTWTDELCRGRNKEELFVPEHFFPDGEAAAWRSHTRSVRPC